MTTGRVGQSGPKLPVDTAAAERLGRATSAREAEGSAKSATNPKSGTGTFEVNISPEAKARAETQQKALDIARATPDVREDRVAEIKAQIQAGTYKVDAGKIADGMLREAIKEHLALTDDR